MTGEFIAYLKIFVSIPTAYYLLAASVAAAVMATVSGGFRKRQKDITIYRIAAYGILSGWLFLTLAETVLCREPGTSRSMQLRLFWSYRSQSREYLVLDLFNILLLLPAGFLLPLCGVKRFRRVLIVGFLWSLMLETLQFITRRGLFEADDLFHNTLGACLGYLIFMLAVRIRKRRRIR